MNRYSVVLRVTGALVLGSFFGTTALAQSTLGSLTGKLEDASTKQPIADVVVTATSPSMMGEQMVVTDAAGTYRLSQLPPGVYSLRFEKESYKPYTRADINLRSNVTLRVDISMLPEALKGEDIVVVGRAPTIDVGSTSTGTTVSKEFMKNIAVVRPGGRGGAARSFESLAVVAPGASNDLYGVSISGTTSPENQYVIDGVSVNDPAFGINASPLSVDFVQEVNVITGGYMPEYGRATGGIMTAVTKSGSNEFHGSVFGNFTPGLLEGEPTEIKSSGTVISTTSKLWNLGAVGADLGGPIMKDKLWFYVGFSPSFTRFTLDRHLNMIQIDANNRPVLDANGLVEVTRIPGTDQRYFADQQSYQYIAKLTYLLNTDHNISLSVYGTPSFSGGNGKFGIDPQVGGPEVGNIIGRYESLANLSTFGATDVVLKLASSFMDKKLLLDVTGGWHNQYLYALPVDGSLPGSTTGLAALPGMVWRKNTAPGYRSIRFFEELPDNEIANQCEAANVRAFRCPVSSYRTGGPGFIGVDIYNRLQAKAVATYLLNAAGHHVFKGGVDIETMSFDRNKAYTGSVLFRENTRGTTLANYRTYGYMKAPNEAEILPNVRALSLSNTIGGFIQDSWNVLDLVTLNAGVRYDSQTLIGDDKLVAITLGNQISPRIGLVYDFTNQGRSKIFANFANFYQGAMLDMIDRQFPGERQVTAARSASANGCNPLDNDSLKNVCTANPVLTLDPYSPNTSWIITGGDKSPVDPNLKPQSSSEIVVGGEYEVFSDARVGASFTRRFMNDVIEDMSRDEATTYFIGNPGSGIASDFPKATRNYNAVTVYFNKNFADLWLAQVSYTWSKLVGNYAGLFRPETGQLDPNINSDFDLISLLDNRSGPLPGDRTHAIKLFAAKEFVLAAGMSVNLGLSFSTRSGAKMNVFASHYLYGPLEVFVLPRGTGGELPWVTTFDGNVGFNMKLSKDSLVTVAVDVFNLLNLQGVTGRDQVFTNADVQPISGENATVEKIKETECAPGTADANGNCADADKIFKYVKYTDGTPLEYDARNKNFGNVTGYQSTRSVRFNVKVTF